MTKGRSKISIKSICFCAMFSALTCVATLISIPLPVGYFNTGDIMVIAGAWCIGPWYGAIAGAFGSALADILLGSAIYAPATLLIKGSMALVAFFLATLLGKSIKKDSLDVLARIPAALVCEVIMVLGYLLYDAFALGYGAAALASVLGNITQGVLGAIGSVIIFSTLKATKAIRIFKI